MIRLAQKRSDEHRRIYRLSQSQTASAGDNQDSVDRATDIPA